MRTTQSDLGAIERRLDRDFERDFEREPGPRRRPTPLVAHGTLKARFAAAAACPVDHEAIKLDESRWSSLEWRGLQDAFDGSGTVLELRNCGCGTTLARPKAQPQPHSASDFIVGPEAA